MKNRLPTDKKISVVFFYRVIFYRSRYEKYIYIKTLDVNSEEFKKIESKKSPFVENDSLLDFIFNIINGVFFISTKFYKFASKKLDFLSQYISLKLSSLDNKNGLFGKGIRKTVDVIDKDLKKTKKHKEELKDPIHVELAIFVNSNFSKNEQLLYRHYPHLKNRWSYEEKKFLEVYRVIVFVYEDIGVSRKKSAIPVYYMES